MILENHPGELKRIIESLKHQSLQVLLDRSRPKQEHAEDTCTHVKVEETAPIINED